MFRIKIQIFVLLLLTSGSSCRSDAFAGNNVLESQHISLDSARIKTGHFDLPMRITPLLSGNFAELRSNHFHSGLDFKTNQVVGTPIYAPADGWVSRVRIAPFGFGLALYLDHDNGFTTVYGHLNRFTDSIAKLVRSWQYHNERFELDTLLSAGYIRVQKGEVIAYAGNSGSSAAPHLHFEIRDTQTEEPVDPLLWFSDRIKDKIPPRVQQLLLYPIQNEGVISTGSSKATHTVSRNKKGEYVVNGTPPTVWGNIGFGLKAYDYMDGTSNSYGIAHIRLFEGETLIFEQDLQRFNFDQTRYVNSLIDYELWLRTRSLVMKSFVEANNLLKVYPAFKNKGILSIDSAKTYHLRYELMDRAGNRTVFRFSVRGQKRSIPIKPTTGQKMESWVPNRFSQADFKLDVPVGALYNDLDFQFSQVATNELSDLYKVHNRFTPVHSPIQAAFKIQRDTLTNKRQYLLARMDEQGKPTRVEATYRNGWMTALLKEFGSYKVLCDTVPPKITPLVLENVVKNNVIRIRIVDDLSGIHSWRGSIDGNWVLFELDGKTGRLTFDFKDSPVQKSKEHSLELWVLDACGNENRLNFTFYW